MDSDRLATKLSHGGANEGPAVTDSLLGFELVEPAVTGSDKQFLFFGSAVTDSVSDSFSLTEAIGSTNASKTAIPNCQLFPKSVDFAHEVDIVDI